MTMAGETFKSHWPESSHILAFSAHLDTYRRSTVSCFEVLYGSWSFFARNLLKTRSC